MKIVFAGTPEFAVPALRAAAGKAEVVAVYTQPDRPSGRGRVLTPSPVKRAAQDMGFPVMQPETLRAAEVQEALRALKPDLMVVVAYGLLLPQAVLDIPVDGCWNVHASLLPRWRGAAPIQRAIEAGDTETGVCLMRMEKGLDTGPVLLEQRTPIGEQETGGELHDRLAALGAQVLIDGLGLLRVGIQPVARPQPAEGVTYARKLDKAEARLDWREPAQVLANRVRAFNPWPMAEADVAGERLRLHAAVALPLAHGAGRRTRSARHLAARLHGQSAHMEREAGRSRPDQVSGAGLPRRHGAVGRNRIGRDSVRATALRTGARSHDPADREPQNLALIIRQDGRNPTPPARPPHLLQEPVSDPPAPLRGPFLPCRNAAAALACGPGRCRESRPAARR